jgi:hypothetical protein
MGHILFTEPSNKVRLNKNYCVDLWFLCHLTTVLQFIRLHNVDDTRVVKLPLEIEIVSPSLWTTLMSHCHKVGPGTQGLVDDKFVERERCLDCNCLCSPKSRFSSVSPHSRRCFHLSSKLSGSGSDAPCSSVSSSWRYTAASFLSFKRSTAKRLSCCDIVLFARLTLYLNFMNLWYESLFAKLRAFRTVRNLLTMIDELLFLSILSETDEKPTALCLFLTYCLTELIRLAYCPMSVLAFRFILRDVKNFFSSTIIGQIMAHTNR